MCVPYHIAHDNTGIIFNNNVTSHNDVPKMGVTSVVWFGYKRSDVIIISGHITKA